MTNGFYSSLSPIQRIYGDFSEFYDALRDTVRGDAPRAADSCTSGACEPAKAKNGFVPAVNIWEEEDSYVVETALPGVSPKDVEITLEGRELRIRGERKRDETEAKKQFHRQEQAYGRFERAIRFPTDVNSDAVEAKSQDGVLRISVRKSEAAKAKKIQII